MASNLEIRRGLGLLEEAQVKIEEGVNSFQNGTTGGTNPLVSQASQAYGEAPLKVGAVMYLLKSGLESARQYQKLL
ncbi:hypothetical protein [Saccharopolyspora sp. 5N708]|uniref:hypothetical protein n=1 Tax=Saccharopolyspora sp. 5N708 TaxID=3457424 RepID=UPI003FD03D7A